MIKSFSGQVVFCFAILRAISAYVGENWLSQYSGVSYNFAKNVISPIEHSHRFFTWVMSQAHSEKGISKGKGKAVCLVVKQ